MLALALATIHTQKMTVFKTKSLKVYLHEVMISKTRNIVFVGHAMILYMKITVIKTHSIQSIRVLGLVAIRLSHLIYDTRLFRVRSISLSQWLMLLAITDGAVLIWS